MAVTATLSSLLIQLHRQHTSFVDSITPTNYTDDAHPSSIQSLQYSSFLAGGPHHFKTRRSLTFVCIELRIMFGFVSVVWNFFAANHGKSICDSHAAHVKSRFWRLAKNGEPLEGVDDYADAVNDYMAGATAKSFKHFNRSEKFDVSIHGEADVVRVNHSYWCPDTVADGESPPPFFRLSALSSSRLTFCSDHHEISVDAEPLQRGCGEKERC